MTSDVTRDDVRRALRMVQSSIARGTIIGVNDGPKMQEVDIRLENGYRPSVIEHWHPYGFTFHPHSGSEIVALALKGNRDHVIVLPAANRQFRMTGLAEGELAVHDDQGQVVHFKRDQILLKSPTKVVVDCPDVNLGGDGGKPVAVEGTLDSAGHPLVSNFATKVKAV